MKKLTTINILFVVGLATICVGAFSVTRWLGLFMSGGCLVTLAYLAEADRRGANK